MFYNLRHPFAFALLAVGFLAASADGFAAAPTLTAFSPINGKLGTTVTITGSNFVNPVTVSFGGVPATTVSVVSSTKLTAVVPDTAPTGKITLSDSGGSVTSGSPFTVVPGIRSSANAGPPTSKPTLTFSGFGPYEAVDFYFDTANLALASVSGRGAGTLPVVIPTGASPGAHWSTAVGRHSGFSAQIPFTVRTDWTQFGFRANHPANDPYESTITPANVANLQEAWRTPLLAFPYCTPTVVGGVLYATFNTGDLRAFNETTGAQIWSTPIGGGSDSSPAVVNGVLYVGSNDKNLYAVNAATGAIIWKYQTGDAVQSSPTVSGGIVYFGSYDSYLYALNAATGALVWKFDTGDGVFSSPAVAYGNVYVGSENGVVFALDAATRTEVWDAQTEANVVASPLVVNGTVYIGSEDKSLYALDAFYGTTVWTYTTGGAIQATAACASGTIFFASDDGKAYAVSQATGALRWSAMAGSRPLNQSVCSANGVIYVGDGVNTYALDATDGGILAIFPAGTSFGGPSVVNGAFNVADYSKGSIVHYTLNAALNSFAAPRPEPSTLRRHDLIQSTACVTPSLQGP